MKKIIYAFVITAALTISSAAYAQQLSSADYYYSPIIATNPNLIRKCEVCPYTALADCYYLWTPTCITDDELTLIDKKQVSPCGDGCKLCKFTLGLCEVCETGYALRPSGTCYSINPIDDPIDDPIDASVIIPITTATVSSCPSGTTKSSDGCCCVN